MGEVGVTHIPVYSGGVCVRAAGNEDQSERGLQPLVLAAVWMHAS